MLIANLQGHGGDLGTEIFSHMSSSKALVARIVSGYVGAETVTRLAKMINTFDEVDFQLVVGMAVKEGLSPITYTSLKNLNDAIARHPNHLQGSGVYVYFADGVNFTRERGIHAKAYLLGRTPERKFVLGSSNFSYSGLSPKGNVELNFVDSTELLAKEFETFFSGLTNAGNLVPLQKVHDFPLKGVASRRRKRALPTGLIRTTKPIGYKDKPFIDLDLARNISNQEKSNLNTCFGKGRWARKTGVVTPRDWYEVELISVSAENSNPIYPKGNFWVTTTDGFRFEARTQGDNHKNLRSKHSLHILGLWIKGECLEESGALSDDPQELVTAETFQKYGNSKLRMYKISKDEYVFDFPRVSPPEEIPEG